MTGREPDRGRALRCCGRRCGCTRRSRRSAAALRGQLDRLDEPLRVAIAGKVKAGKSTLLNGLVGELIAPTDAGECTKVVTWYRDGPTPRVVSYPDDGPPRPLPCTAEDGALAVQLRGVPAERLRKLVVDWPSQSLRGDHADRHPRHRARRRRRTSRRTLSMLTPGRRHAGRGRRGRLPDAPPARADAEFLESFRDQGVARASSVNTIAVISRADEVGGGRIDAMLSARRIARRYRAEPALRGLCQTVIPVAGPARGDRPDVAAAGVRHARRARRRAARGHGRRAAVHAPVPALGPGRRRSPTCPTSAGTTLLERFGLFGLRLSMMHIRQGRDDSTALAAELVRGSGLTSCTRCCGCSSRSAATC